MTTTALKTRPSARASRSDATQECKAVEILRLLAQNCRDLQAARDANPFDGHEGLLALMSSRIAAAALTVPRTDLGHAFQQLTLYVHSFTLNPELSLPDLVRKCCPEIYADLCKREDLRISAALQAARRAVLQQDDPDLSLVAKHYLPVSATERRDMLKACGVYDWRRA